MSKYLSNARQSRLSSLIVGFIVTSILTIAASYLNLVDSTDDYYYYSSCENVDINYLDWYSVIKYYSCSKFVDSLVAPSYLAGGLSLFILLQIREITLTSKLLSILLPIVVLPVSIFYMVFLTPPQGLALALFFIFRKHLILATLISFLFHPFISISLLIFSLLRFLSLSVVFSTAILIVLLHYLMLSMSGYELLLAFGYQSFDAIYYYLTSNEWYETAIIRTFLIWFIISYLVALNFLSNTNNYIILGFDLIKIFIMMNAAVILSGLLMYRLSTVYVFLALLMIFSRITISSAKCCQNISNLNTDKVC